MPVIQVATLNLHNRQDHWLERRKMIVAELVDTRPDLLSLQEIYLPLGQARWLRNQINSRLTGSARRPYQLVQRARGHLIGGFFDGVGILSRLPIVSHDALNLGYGGRMALRANVELPNRANLDFVAVHFQPGSADREAREEQALQLTGWLSTHQPTPMQVIAGDFNETPDGPAIKLVKQTFHSAFEEFRGYEPPATYPTALKTNSDGWSGCLDYVFVSRAANRVKEARLFCNRPSPDDPRIFPSDHVGLLVTLDLSLGYSKTETVQELGKR